jgi:hypothetical protein
MGEFEIAVRGVYGHFHLAAGEKLSLCTPVFGRLTVHLLRELAFGAEVVCVFHDNVEYPGLCPYCDRRLFCFQLWVWAVSVIL